MNLELSLRRFVLRAAILLFAIVVCGGLIIGVVSDFIVGTLTDERAAPSATTLEAAADYFPNSARLHGRLAETMEQQGDLSRAELHIRCAIARSPYNYRFAVTLASIEESKGDYEQAEQSLRSALNLAPTKAEVYWSLANLLLRKGELGNSLEEFRTAASLKKSLLPATQNLIWRASNGSIEALKFLAGDDPEARITLAGFLLNHSRATEAAEELTTIDRRARLASGACASLVNEFIESNNLALARSIWSETVEANGQEPVLISNGSFESHRVDGFSQFDWRINRSDFAKVAIVKGNSRTGAHSLRLEFAGRDTTRLDNEIEQLVVVNPGGRYRIECYARAEGLVTSEGPRMVVSPNPSGSARILASSEPVAVGVDDWQHLVADFVAPASLDGRAVGLYVSIKRHPRFSYDEPTHGRIYFDDFALIEQTTVARELPSVRKPPRARGHGSL